MKRSAAAYLLTAGFVLGVLFEWWYYRSAVVIIAAPSDVPAIASPSSRISSEKSPAVAPAVVEALGDVERYFQRWGGYAVWENDLTEFALWNKARQKHDAYYQVRRVNGEFFFRTLRQLTRPLIDHGVRSKSPIHFTETAAMREAFYAAHPSHRWEDEPVAELSPKAPERFASATIDDDVIAPGPPPILLTPDPQRER